MREIEYTTEKQIEIMREEIRQAKLKLNGENEEVLPEVKHLQTKKMIKKVAGLLSFSFIVVFLFSLLISVLMAKQRGETPDLIGYQLYVIESGSMSPTLKVGAVILSKKISSKETLKVDDIVTFKTTSGATVTHRIIGVVKDQSGNISYRTKGDNPVNTPDLDLLTPDRVIAKFIAKVPLT